MIKGQVEKYLKESVTDIVDAENKSTSTETKRLSNLTNAVIMAKSGVKLAEREEKKFDKIERKIHRKFTEKIAKENSGRNNDRGMGG